MHSSIVYFYKAWLAGFIMAAIVGPIAILCIRKTLEHSFWHGIAVGTGASIADGIYGLLAGAGVTAISSFLVEKSVYIKAVGGFFLLYLGYLELKPRKSYLVKGASSKSTIKLLIQSFLLTMSSPMTIISFIAIFASIAKAHISLRDTVYISFGLFLGSMCWWIILAGVVAKIKHKIPEIWLSRISYASAIIIIGFGLWSIGDCIYSFLQVHLDS